MFLTDLASPCKGVRRTGFRQAGLGPAPRRCFAAGWAGDGQVAVFPLYPKNRHRKDHISQSEIVEVARFPRMLPAEQSGPYDAVPEKERGNRQAQPHETGRQRVRDGHLTIIGQPGQSEAVGPSACRAAPWCQKPNSAPNPPLDVGAAFAYVFPTRRCHARSNRAFGREVLL